MKSSSFLLQKGERMKSMEIKLLVFDLDDTIAETGKEVLAEHVEIMRRVEEAGVHIAICSGKPTYYLCGFMRQIGLKEPVLIGENGGVVQFGVDLPPERYYILPYSVEAARSIEHLKEKIMEILPQMFFQPNLVGLTPFPKNREEYDAIARLIREEKDQLKDVDIYQHFDCFDIMPSGIDKGSGLKYLGGLLKISPEEMMVAGDGINDYPMFSYAGTSLGIHLEEPEKVSMNFQDNHEMFLYLKKRFLSM